MSHRPWAYRTSEAEDREVPFRVQPPPAVWLGVNDRAVLTLLVPAFALGGVAH